MHVTTVGLVAVLVALAVGLAIAAAEHRAPVAQGSAEVTGPARQTPSTASATPRTTGSSPTGPAPTRPAPTAKASTAPVSLNDKDWKLVPMPTLSPYHDAVIRNDAASRRTLRVCRSWSETTCATSSPRGDLLPGEDSETKFGWKDTDGFDTGNGWVQQHGCFRCVVTVTAR